MITCAVWWAVPVDDTAEHRGLLTDVERDRYSAYRKSDDRRRFLTGRVMAKTLIGERLGTPAADVVFDAACDDCDKQHGPPRIPGSTLRLSISHAGDRVGLALTDGAELGLDVEATTRHADDGLLDYALSDAERAAVAGLADSDRTRAFFRYWTGKEALMKATGKGLRIGLTSLTLSEPGEPARLVASESPALDPATTRLASLRPGDGYDASVAVLTGEELEITEHWWSPRPAALGH
ncbi:MULTISPECIES: 4'-phosphopantetheinyl transferase family protein [Prauserella salsuginis group]|uniref:4'-phosphopantetheinyl transferase family protein n=1 Tax=Prauserella salsuginis TaxID=387889 RepID=A0ABW6GAP1_9PSEU|nr:MULTISPECIES: 4'-phosphopantetheinyl transferase superfamily protein [Prauserella salsuginis group]MCR3720658.1 4'-phosphopantetheinyl transferase [Prauserella flava]MCR3735261.1 4'-phosphopantetheinyl transferase [Prauserella salsuginis]